MQIVMGQDSGSSSDEGIHEDEYEPESTGTKTSLLSTLPTELIDRIIHHAISPNTSSSSSSSHNNPKFLESIRQHEAYNLCLVCRQFDQLSRSRLYKKVNVSTRKMKSFLATLVNNPKLASMVRDLTLDSRIWTDVDENVIVKIFLEIRQYCIRVKVGANESPLLPYLLYGDISEDDPTSPIFPVPPPSAIRALEICWRDEVEVQSQAAEEEQLQSNSNTLQQLFQHSESTIVPPPLSYLTKFDHLTLDLYSQAQLNQLFESDGYFIKNILPRLRFLRVEMPYVVLQFKSEEVGGLVAGWPRDDWRINNRNLQEAIEDRQDQIRRIVAETDQRPSTTSSFTDLLPPQPPNTATTLLTNAEENVERMDQAMIMPYCPSNQLKSLSIRFLLNVHRNDKTLFKLLLPPQALEESWSTKASISAQCLSSTMAMHLNRGLGTEGTMPENVVAPLISFPFAEYKKKGAELYWKEKRLEAQADYASSLPIEVQTTDDQSGELEVQTSKDSSLFQESIKVSLLLKWPSVVDAFFHVAATNS